MVDLSWYEQFINVIGRIFPGDAVGLAIQRGFISAGVFLFLLGCYLLTRRPGTWYYYVLRTHDRVAEAQLLADDVADIEGKAAGIQDRIDSLLKELDIVAGKLPEPVNAPTIITAPTVAPAAATVSAPASVPGMAKPPSMTLPGAPVGGLSLPPIGAPKPAGPPPALSLPPLGLPK